MAILQSTTPILKNGLPFTGAIIINLTNFLNPGINPSLLGTTYLYVLNGRFVDGPITQNNTNYSITNANYYVKYICDALENISCYGLCHNTHQWDLTGGGVYDFYPDIFLGSPQTFIRQTASDYQSEINQLETDLSTSQTLNETLQDIIDDLPTQAEYDACTSELAALQQQIANSTTEEELAQCLIDLADAQAEVNDLTTENEDLMADLETCTQMLEDKMTEDEINSIINNVLDNCPQDGQIPAGTLKFVEFQSEEDVVAQEEKENLITQGIETLGTNLCQTTEKLSTNTFRSNNNGTVNGGNADNNDGVVNGSNNASIPGIDQINDDNNVTESSVRSTVRDILSQRLKSKKAAIGLKAPTPTEPDPEIDINNLISGIKKNCNAITFPKKLVLQPSGQPEVCEPETPADPEEPEPPILEEGCPCDPDDSRFFVNPN